MNIAEIAIQEAGNDEPLEKQKEVSCCWMANLLANDARDFYGEIWKTGRHQPMHNRYIDQVCRASKEYGRRHDKTLYLTDRQIKRIEDSVHVIANKICEWVVEDYNQEKDAKKANTGPGLDENAGADRKTAIGDAGSVRVRCVRQVTG